MPHSLKVEPPFAMLFKLAFTALPPDEDDRKEACNTFLYDVLDKKLKLQVQYRYVRIFYCKTYKSSVCVYLGY